MLSDGMVVLNGPFRVASGTAYGWLAKGGVAHTQHARLSWQPIQIQADAVKVSIGSASGQRGSHRVLRGCILRHRFLKGIQQDSIDVGQFPEHPQKSRSCTPASAILKPVNLN